MPVALVSAVVPPSWSGSAVLISRLLDGEDPDAYRLLTSAQGCYEGAHIGGLATPCFRLPPRAHPLPQPQQSCCTRPRRWPARGPASCAVPTGSPGSPGANAGAIAFTGDFHDVPGAHVSARLLRVPLYVYMLDYYSHRERAIRRRGHLDAAGVAAAQQGADVLFLPLAFRSQCPEVIRTSAPMKSADTWPPRRPDPRPRAARMRSSRSTAGATAAASSSTTPIRQASWTPRGFGRRRLPAPAS